METAGQALAQAEHSIGTAIRQAVRDHYQGHDLDTARTIRQAPREDEAVDIVTAIRQGRAREVLLIGGSAVLGVVAGVLAQRLIADATVKGIPIAAPVGLAPVIAGLALPAGLAGRSMLATSGLSFSAGATLYHLLSAPREEMP